jgi:DNA-binding NarL/FixJ family response regulator
VASASDVERKRVGGVVGRRHVETGDAHGGQADPDQWWVGSVIRLLIADDHGIVREGLVRLFATVPDVEVVGSAADGREVVALAAQTMPDVVLMDVGMPQVDGVEATRRITAAHPACRIVMLTVHGDQARIRDALRAGAVEYLLKDSRADEIVRAVQAVHVAATVPGVAGRAGSDDVRF